MPAESTTFLERLGLGALAGAGAVILLLRHFLLAGDSAPGTLLGPRVGVGPLAANRETAAMPDAPIAADVHQALDVHGDFGAQRSLYLDRSLDHLAEAGDFRVRQVSDPRVGTHAGFAQNTAAGGPADTKDVGKCDLNPLFAREIHASNARHDQPCRCLCLGLRLQ